jgi:hypothetical protein
VEQSVEVAVDDPVDAGSAGDLQRVAVQGLVVMRRAVDEQVRLFEVAPSLVGGLRGDDEVYLVGQCDEGRCVLRDEGGEVALGVVEGGGDRDAGRGDGSPS